ncbi:MAG: glycogen synthase [Candidatus Hydrogenedentes bacterium]|nr:glycogen synthase [Candidatus Hydrogenedentota bacterium]
MYSNYPALISSRKAVVDAGTARKILLVSAELTPLVSVGGIGEYILGLGSALLRQGHDVRVVLPSYGFLRARDGLTLLSDRLVVPLGVGATEISPVHELTVECPGADGRTLTVMLAGNHKHFETVRSASEIYTWPNHEPWIAYSRAVMELISVLDWQPDVVHCHDAQTALLPVYVSQLRQQQPDSMASAVRTVLTIHNLLNQGNGDPALVAYAGLPTELFNLECFEFYGRANCLKAGLLRADMVNTVSRTYADEICRSDEYGFGLSGVLRGLRERERLTGVINGIDDQRWALSGLDYSGSGALKAVDDAKRKCQRSLFSTWKWKDTGDPVIGIRSRWDMQKGVGIIAAGLPKLLTKARVVLVAWGVPGATPELMELWEVLNLVAKQHPDRLRLNPPELSSPSDTSLHYTLADFFLMPSRYEPCGLVQMECQRYGAIPIVRATGGLADTVSEMETDSFPSPNGFVFDQFEPADMTAAAARAIKAYHNANDYSRLQSNALAQRNGWESRVPAYEKLYQS